MATFEPATTSFVPASSFVPEQPQTYDAPALSKLWVQAGGKPEDADLMAQVARNESSGNPSAKNQYTEGGKTYNVRGLWQISDIHGQGNYDDPLENAKKAVELHRASGMTPWESSRTKGGEGGWEKYLTQHASSHAEADTRNRDFMPPKFVPAGSSSSVSQASFIPAEAPVGGAMPGMTHQLPSNKPTAPMSAPVLPAVGDAMTKAIDYTAAGALPASVVAKDMHFYVTQRKKLSGAALEAFDKKFRDGVVDSDIRPNEAKLPKDPKEWAKALADPAKMHQLVEGMSLTGDGPGSYSDVVDAVTKLGQGADHGVKPPDTFGGAPLSLQSQLSGHSAPKDQPSQVGRAVSASKPALNTALDIIPQAVNPTGALARTAGGVAKLAGGAIKDTGIVQKGIDAATDAIHGQPGGAKLLSMLASTEQGVNVFAGVRREAVRKGIDPDIAEQVGRTYKNAPAVARSNATNTIERIYTNTVTGKFFPKAHRLEIERISEGLQPRLADSTGEIMRAAQDVRDVYSTFTNDQVALDLMKEQNVFDPGQYTFRGGDVYKKLDVPPDVQAFKDEFRSTRMKPASISGSTINEHKTFSNYDEAAGYLDADKYDPADQLLTYMVRRGTNVGRERAVRQFKDMGIINDIPVLDPKTGAVMGIGKAGDEAADRVAARTARFNANTNALSALNKIRAARGDAPLTMGEAGKMQKAVREKSKFRQRGQEAQRAADEAQRFADRAHAGADRTEQVAGDALKAEIDKRVTTLDRLNATIAKSAEMGQQGDREAAGRSLIAASEQRDLIALELDTMREKAQRTAEDVYGHMREPSPNTELNAKSEAYYDAVVQHGPESPEAQAAFKATEGMQRVDEPRPDIYAPAVGRIQDIYEAAKELPPGPARAKVLNMLTHIGKRGVKGPTKISDRINAEKLLRQTQQAMSHVAGAGRDITSLRIVNKLNDLAQSLERGIAKDDSRLYARKSIVADPAHRVADVVNLGSKKAADRTKKLLDAWDFSKASEGDVQAFNGAFRRAMQHATTDRKNDILNKSRAAVQNRMHEIPFVATGKEAEYNFASGSPTLKFATAPPGIVRFFLSQGARDRDAEGLAVFTDGMGRLTRMGMISNPVVHAGWNLGTHYLAAGGDMGFFTNRLWKDPSEWGQVGSKTGAEWAEDADRWNAVVHMADTHPVFGGSYAQNFLDEPGAHGAKQALNAGVTQLWHQNQRIVFNEFETRYSVDLFRHFVEDEKMTPQAAGIAVRKALGDYTNISRSGIEGALHQSLLFYPWLKTALPFWAKTLVTRPSFVAIPGVGIRRWDQAMGDPDVGNENPLTLDFGADASGGRRKMTYPGPQKWVGDILSAVWPKNADTNEVGSHLNAVYKLVQNHLQPWSPLGAGLPVIGTYAPHVQARDPRMDYTAISNIDLPLVPDQLKQMGSYAASNLIPGAEAGAGLLKGAQDLAKGDVRGLTGASGGFQYTTLPRGQQHVLTSAQSTLDRALKHANSIKSPTARAAAIKAARTSYAAKQRAVERMQSAASTKSTFVPAGVVSGR